MNRLEFLFREALSGGVVSIISIAYCVSFAALIFSGPLAPGFALGLDAILLGACASGLGVALGSSLRRAVGGPDTPVIAVFAALAATVAASAPAGADALALTERALAAVSLATLATGMFLVALGALRLGAAFRFVPYSVVAGFLAASACLLIAGGCRLALGGDDVRIAEIFEAATQRPATLEPLFLALGFVVVVLLVRRRNNHFYILPAAFCVFILAIYGYLAATGRPPGGPEAAGWFLSVPTGDGMGLAQLAPTRLGDAALDLLANFGEIAAVAVITALAVMLNASGLEAVWKTNCDLDREFRATGLANMAAGALGGVAGNISLNRSMLNRECGAVGRLSATIPPLVCLALLVFGSEILTAVPRPALTGLLFFLGVSLLHNSLAWGNPRRNWPEYLLTIGITLLIVFVGFLEGLFVGLVGAALLFAYNYSRVDMIKREFTRRDRSSTVDRSSDQASFLATNGRKIRGVDLHGYLFFATSNRLVEDLKGRFQSDIEGTIEYLILDFRLVSGIDISTALSFAKLRNACEERSVTLILSAMSPAVAEILAEGRYGVVDGVGVRQFRTLDEALEWAEGSLLAANALATGGDETFEAWLAQQFGATSAEGGVLGYMERLIFAPGDVVVSQGEAADSVDVFASGRVRVELVRPGEPPLRLRSVLRRTVLGEMGFYRGADRAATVIAEEETIVYRMRRQAYRRMSDEAPLTAAAFDRFIIRILSDRLTFANSEIAALAL